MIWPSSESGSTVLGSKLAPPPPGVGSDDSPADAPAEGSDDAAADDGADDGADDWADEADGDEPVVLHAVRISAIAAIDAALRISLDIVLLHDGHRGLVSS
jgi:hypothetical protein